MKIQIVLFDEFDLLDVVAPYEVFTACTTVSDAKLTLELVSAEGARHVPSGITGLTLETIGGIDLENTDLLVVPGAAGDLNSESSHSVPAILGRALETELPPILAKAMAKPGLTVATVCGGSLLLGLAGLLDNRPAVTHHMGMEILGATGAIPVKARVVDDGDFVSAGGVTSGLDLALHLVEREIGPRIAHAVEILFEYERRGTVWHARGLAATLGAER
jgi:transcriptional regulator GlxA family with amidase domain